MRGCPSLVGGRPAKPVVGNGRAGSNPAPRAKSETAFPIPSFLQTKTFSDCFGVSRVRNSFVGGCLEAGAVPAMHGGPSWVCPIDFNEVEGDFRLWLQGRASGEYVKQVLSCLRRFGRPIRQPIDVAKAFSRLTVGQRHHMIRALRNIFKFYKCQVWRIAFG